MRILEAQSEMIALLLTDVIMPHVGGRQLAESVLRRWPHKRVLYMSGYTDDAVVRQGIVEARVGFLQKPLSADVLARKVRELLDTTANRASSPQSPQSHEVLRNRTLPLPTGSERILLVDDDEVVCLLATKNLQALGYQVAMAQSAAQALELWEQADGGFDLLLTDVRMPGAMSGQALGRCLRQRKTDLKVLIMSGYNEDRLAEFDSEAVADFLQKPYTRLELAQAVRNCLDGRGTL
jgi:DNA-binding NtrC family response regulator